MQKMQDVQNLSFGECRSSYQGWCYGNQYSRYYWLLYAFQYGEKIKYLVDNVTNIDRAILSTHRNDLGMAAVSSLSGVFNGARQVEVTINGGERAGNTSSEKVAMALKCHKTLGMRLKLIRN